MAWMNLFAPTSLVERCGDPMQRLSVAWSPRAPDRKRSLTERNAPAAHGCDLDATTRFSASLAGTRLTPWD